MVGNLNLLTSCKIYDGPIKSIKLPNGERVLVTHIGDAKITDKITVTSILYAPSLEFNFLSVSRPTMKHQYLVAFFPDMCLMQDLQGGRTKVSSSRMVEGLYILRICQNL